MNARIIVLQAVISMASSANILCYFGFPSYSHQLPMLAVARALVSRGHNLTVISPNPLEHPPVNYTNVDLSFSYEFLKSGGGAGLSLQTKLGQHELLLKFGILLEKLSEIQLNSSAMQEFLRWSKHVTFDLFLYEAQPQLSVLGVAHHVNSPPIVGFVTLHSIALYDTAMGNSHNPAYTPSIFHPFSDHMTLWQRAVSTYFYVLLAYLNEMMYRPKQEKVLRQFFGDEPPSVWELEFNKSLLLVSADLSTGYPQPNLPNVIYTGPLHIVQPKPLSRILQEWLEGAENGVVYFSLGSNMRGESLPEAKRRAFLGAFEQLKGVRVLWKWESDKPLPGQLSNVLTQKWLPQQSILAHPKVRVFITQGGLQSIQEAIHHAVPLIGIPLFGDQPFNILKMEKAGVGLKIDFEKITTESVLHAIKEVLDDPSYQKNMNHHSKLSKDRPMRPMDQAVWWIEYVIRHNGASHLKPASLNLAWYQYLLLDVLIVFFIILLFFAFVLVQISKFVYTHFMHNRKTKKC